MLNYDDTLILFGRSPYISKIDKYIPELCSKYHTMGCNYFCNTYPDVEYVVFFDDIVPNIQPHHTIITNIKHAHQEAKKCNRLVRGHKKTELYIINRDSHRFTDNAYALNFCIHTPSMALNWAYKKGFKTVVLAGIDLVLNTPHFDKDTTPDADGPDFTSSAIFRAREHLTKVATQYLDIYQLNPKSDIDLPKIKIKDLLK